MNMWPYFLLRHIGDFAASSEISAMKEQFPDMEFSQVESSAAILAANLRVLVVRSAHRLGLLNKNRKLFQYLWDLQFSSYLPDAYVEKMRPDVIFAYSHAPKISARFKVPVVAVEYLASERYMRKAGVSHCLPLEITAKRRALEHASSIIAMTPGSLLRFNKYIPELDGRVVQAPVYQANVEPVSEEWVMEKTRNDEVINVLFVGATAHRKGLPQVLEALGMVGEPIRNRLKFSVVSKFYDGPVAGIGKRVEVLSNVSASRLKDLMREAHIFVFPTQYDSYGRVIVEALAAGCAVITSDTDPQDWMLDYGKAGRAVDPESPRQIAEALVELVSDRDIRRRYALEAVRRFRSVFYHRTVGAQYREAFEVAIHKAHRPQMASSVDTSHFGKRAY